MSPPIIQEWLEKFTDVEQLYDDGSTLELTNNTGTQLQHLNVDCLLNIFSAKSLTLLDWCSIAETCTRFRQIVYRVVKKELRILHRDNGCYEIESTPCRSRNNVKRIFKNFGPLLIAVSINGWTGWKISKDNFVLNELVRRYDNPLKSLKMNGMKICQVVIDQLRLMFKQLQMLSLQFVVLGDDTTLFDCCDALVELNMMNVNNCNAIFENVFPKLERFEFEKTFDSAEEEEELLNKLIFIISRHSNLKAVQLFGYCTDIAIVLPSIPKISKALEGLHGLEDFAMELGVQREFGYHSPMYIQQLHGLKSLRSVKLSHVQFENFQLFSSLTELRELKLTCSCLPIDSNEFNSLNQLSKLEMIECKTITKNVFDDAIIWLTNLNDLLVCHIDDGWKEYRVRIKGRLNELKLICNYDFIMQNSGLIQITAAK